MEVGKSVKVEVKSKWASKTLWFNVLYTVSEVLVVLLNAEWVVENPQVVAVLMSIQGVVNLILRFITTQPIA